MFILFDPDKVAQLFEIRENFCTSIKPVHTGIAVLIGHSAVFADNRYCLKIVALADFIIICIVCRGNFQCTGTEVNIDIIVSDDRDMPSSDRHYGKFSDQIKVTGITGIDSNGHIAENGFGPDGSNGDESSGMAGKSVLYIDKIIATRLHDNLFVGKCRL